PQVQILPPQPTNLENSSNSNVCVQALHHIGRGAFFVLCVEFTGQLARQNIPSHHHRELRTAVLQR
ncbi:MAG: hypothetical protein QE484_05115, partial [Rhizobium sp.]|nr:hypothetical protein [Rhizobium sp.]